MQPPPQPVAPPVVVVDSRDVLLERLQQTTKVLLNEQARALGIESPVKIKKDDLIAKMLDAQVQANAPVEAPVTDIRVEPLEQIEGILDVLPDGRSFLRTTGYLPAPDDLIVPIALVQSLDLRRGDTLFVERRAKSPDQRIGVVERILTINERKAEDVRKRPAFDKLTPIYPNERFMLETPNARLTPRLLDLFCPIGKGQRALIVAPPKTGKTTVLKQIAAAITQSTPKAHLIALLVDERPEEVTDLARSIVGEIVASTFDEQPDQHVALAEMTIERAKRLVEQGKDVVILLDSITRLARAYNHVQPSSGRTLSGGLDTASLLRPKRFFGAARKLEEGGSLTIIATALVETGSKMDDIIFEEFKGTGNLEINLSRRLAEARIFPAVDLRKSGTRHEELLLDEFTLRKVWALRRAPQLPGPSDFTENILGRLQKTRSNEEFLHTLSSETLEPRRPAPTVRSDRSHS